MGVYKHSFVYGVRDISRLMKLDITEPKGVR